MLLDKVREVFMPSRIEPRDSIYNRITSLTSVTKEDALDYFIEVTGRTMLLISVNFKSTEFGTLNPIDISIKRSEFLFEYLQAQWRTSAFRALKDVEKTVFHYRTSSL